MKVRQQKGLIWDIITILILDVMLHLVIGRENLNWKKQFHLLLFMEKKFRHIYFIEFMLPFSAIWLNMSVF